MSHSPLDTCRILVPSGLLGSGCPQAAFDRGISFSPDVIAVDAGSTDSGPHYLGAGVSKMTRKAVKRDLHQLMIGRAKLGIPLLIGSCGTSGTDSGVDWVADICAEIAAEEKQSLKVAQIYSEQDPGRLATYLAKGAVSALPPATVLTPERLAECDHIVALMGYEPFAAAINNGADIVLAGRTTDTAVLAAVPLMRGFPAGPAWHAAKIAECGGLCTTQPRQGGVMLSIDAGGFDVEPLHATNTCTPYSVSAHMLYENAHPYVLKEPGILLDAKNAVYTAIDERVVRVTGSTHTVMPYTMKLEGSGAIGFRTMVFSAIADPKILANLDLFLERLQTHLIAGITSVLGYAPAEYALDIRPYGSHALAQPGRRNSHAVPQEVGLMALVTADTQDKATEIAKFSNPILLHFPLTATDPMPSFAFAFSPAEVELGRLYEFKLNHVVAIADPLELTRTTYFATHQGERRAIA
jgi:Acyclic terpene utilisation family protein AtuA